VRGVLQIRCLTQCPSLCACGPEHNKEPYIFLRARGEQVIYQARGLCSQTIRRVLCEVMDRDDPDWMQAPRLDWVKETVEAWAKHSEKL
jgi:hypothetical protein